MVGKTHFANKKPSSLCEDAIAPIFVSKDYKCDKKLVNISIEISLSIYQNNYVY